jgi:tetratricopeptide (TPR) repeat protein
MRRVLVLAAVAALAIVLLFILRQRKEALVAAQVQLLRSDDARRATAAADTLQKIGRAATRQVCALLEHEDEQIRARAALTLANMGDARAAGPLMEAAKRGDFPAVDALRHMENARYQEARAWAYWRLAERARRERELQSPIGGRPPTADCLKWDTPGAQFRPAQREVISFPRNLDSRWEAAGWVPRDRRSESQWYALARDIRGAGEQTEDAEALATLRRKMEEHLIGATVDPVLQHATWRAGDTAHCVGMACWPHLVRTDFGSTSQQEVPRKLVVFRYTAGPMQRAVVTVTSSIAIFTCADLESMVQPRACSGLIRIEPSRAAVPVLVRSFRPTHGPWEEQYVHYELVMYRLDRGILAPLVSLPASAMPWVGDLDGDGDAEIVTWRSIGIRGEPIGWESLGWPEVRTLVDGQYKVRTEQFRSLVADVAAALDRLEKRLQQGGDHSPPDYPTVPEYLGRAYEILGETEAAIAAYERAERKYLASGDRKAAQTLRERWLRLEGSGEG